MPPITRRNFLLAMSGAAVACRNAPRVMEVTLIVDGMI